MKLEMYLHYVFELTVCVKLKRNEIENVCGKSVCNTICLRCSCPHHTLSQDTIHVDARLKHNATSSFIAVTYKCLITLC